MSASLVGSEMCIRDSPTSLAPALMQTGGQLVTQEAHKPAEPDAGMSDLIEADEEGAGEAVEPTAVIRFQSWWKQNKEPLPPPTFLANVTPVDTPAKAKASGQDPFCEAAGDPWAKQSINVTPQSTSTATSGQLVGASPTPPGAGGGDLLSPAEVKKLLRKADQE
eukprot:12232033-Alexandrium_andersonii.AAC.1